MAVINIEYPENFLEEETRNDHTITKEVKYQWLVLIDLLEKFKSVCTKYNLTWYADGGTLLGAIRHKGFIPWDDDIDIIMPRKDYDKYCEVADKECTGTTYFNANIYNDPLFRKTFSRLRNTSTTFVSTSTDANYNFCQAVFIDIFPVDNFPDDNTNQRIILHTVYTYKNVFSAYRTPYAGKPKESGKTYFAAIKQTLDQYNKLVTTLNTIDCKKGITYSTSSIKKQFIKTNAYYKDGAVVVPFEFTTINVPVHYEDCLVEQFGKNWATPIKAKSNHACFFLDLYNPYTKYIGKSDSTKKLIKLKNKR